jgi:hypothetical protein
MEFCKPLRVCLKNGNWTAAVLLPGRFMSPFLIPQCGTRNRPARARPKSLAAALSDFSDKL